MEQVSRLLAIASLAFLIAAPYVLAQPQPGGETAKPSAGVSGGEGSADSTFTIENSLSVRDPFRRPAPSGPQVDDTTPELLRYEIDKFKLVGVITGPKKAKAMLTSPSGKMHIVAEEMPIGTRRGFIKKIAPGMIEIEEKVINLLGQEENIDTVIEIKDEKPKLEGPK